MSDYYQSELVEKAFDFDTYYPLSTCFLNESVITQVSSFSTLGKTRKTCRIETLEVGTYASDDTFETYLICIWNFKTENSHF